MAQQANTKPNEMSTIESTPQLSASTKGAFFAWLDVGHTKKYSPTVCLLCMDKVSDYLIRRKIVVFDLWQFTNYELFEIIYNKASNDKLLKATDKKMHALFVQIGQLYLKFLKTKPALHKVPISADGAPSPSDSRLTIKKAIIQVLADETHGLTPEQIYNKIIENHLYTFGAKNPKAIVCVEINRACENSNCTIRASKNYFRFEINPEGKKVYFLLETNKISARKHCSSDSSETVGQINRTSHNYFTVDERVMSAVSSILEEHFPNGIRPNSVIDMNRLKGYCHEVDGAEILSESIDIPSLLTSIGILHEEKIFAIPRSAKKKILELMNRLITADNRLFYYDELYGTYTDFFLEMRIFSPELLNAVLLKLLPSLHYSKSSFSIERNVTVASEVLRCYESAVCLSYDQLKSKLPYVPIDKIKQALAQNSDFIWAGIGIYTHISKLVIDTDEWHMVEKKIEAELSECGFVSLASIAFPASLELNAELSKTAVKNGLYQLFLANRYEKRGNIITPKGTALNAASIFAGYCLASERLTVDSLFDFEKEICGSTHSQSLFVAYDTMVRIDIDTFVADSEIDFDVELIDKALALFVNPEVIPLRAVTSFSSFPYIEGYSWNLFLLESYCRRFSRQFNFQCLSVSSRNVGAIFRKSVAFTDYATVLAAVVANAEIGLTERDVGDFLFDSGYIARRTSVISDVIAGAHILRERRA